MKELLDALTDAQRREIARRLSISRAHDEAVPPGSRCEADDENPNVCAICRASLGAERRPS